MPWLLIPVLLVLGGFLEGYAWAPRDHVLIPIEKEVRVEVPVEVPVPYEVKVPVFKTVTKLVTRTVRPHCPSVADALNKFELLTVKPHPRASLPAAYHLGQH